MCKHAQVRRRAYRGKGSAITIGEQTKHQAKKALFSLAVTFEYGRKTIRKKNKTKLLFIDVRRAFCYAAARRGVYVTIPPEDDGQGMVGKVMKSMHGTRDAASNW